MKHPFILLSSCILGLILLSQNNTQASGNFSVSARMQYFNYEEFDDNGLSLNKETGFIHGIGFKLIDRNHQLNLEIYDGTVDYDGQLQSGTPHQTDTEEMIYYLSYRYLIPVFETPERYHYYFGISHQTWERNILPRNNINGLFETYRWLTASAGIESVVHQLSDSQLSIGLGFIYIVDAEIEIDLSDLGYGEPVLDIENKPGFEAELKYTSTLSDSRLLNIGVQYTHSQFGKSNSAALSNGSNTIIIFEPDSTSNHVRFYLEVNQRF